MNIWFARVIWFFITWAFWYFVYLGIGEFLIKFNSDKDFKNPRFRDRKYRLTISFLTAFTAFLLHYL